MLDTAKRALNEESVELAVSVFGKDNLLDEINANVSNVLTTYLEAHKGDIRMCLDLASVFRKLERSGDHITNLAEEIVFYIDAEVLKHQGKTEKTKLSEEKNEKE